MWLDTSRRMFQKAEQVWAEKQGASWQCGDSGGSGLCVHLADRSRKELSQAVLRGLVRTGMGTGPGSFSWLGESSVGGAPFGGKMNKKRGAVWQGRR